MDNYLDDDNVNEALIYAEKALKFKPESFTYNVIYSIIRAQNEYGKEIYDLTKLLVQHIFLQHPCQQNLLVYGQLEILLLPFL